MKTLSVLTLGLLFGLTLAPTATAAPQFGNARERVQSRDRVCVYQDVRFVGWEQCYNIGDEVRSLGSRTKAISSIRVFGRARIIVYEDPEFKGHPAEFSSDVPDLGLRANGGSHTWNDQIESLRVVADGNTERPGGPVFDSREDSRNEPRRNNPFNDGVCVYERPDYQGREQCWSDGSEISDLGRSGNWSNRISSIRVIGRARAVLYRDIDFRGESVVIDRDVPDLRDVRAGGFRNWDRQASSIAVENERNGRGRGRGRR